MLAGCYLVFYEEDPPLGIRSASKFERKIPEVESSSRGQYACVGSDVDGATVAKPVVGLRAPRVLSERHRSITVLKLGPRSNLNDKSTAKYLRTEFKTTTA